MALDLRERLLRLQRVVDDDNVGTRPRRHAADRGSDAATLRRRLEFGYRLMAWCEAGREEALVPVAGEYATAIAR
jgi:hypothetical protein